MIRAAGLQGQGALDLRGAAGSAAGDVGGGGGSGGTLWLDLPVTDSLAVTPEHAGGAGAKGVVRVAMASCCREASVSGQDFSP